MRFVHKSNEVTDAPLAIEPLYTPERYLTFAMRYNPSNKPVTLLVNGSSTAAQRFSKGGGGWPGLCAWVQDNNCSENGSHTCAITKNNCTEKGARRDVFKPMFPFLWLVCSTSTHRNSTSHAYVSGHSEKGTCKCCSYVLGVFISICGGGGRVSLKWLGDFVYGYPADVQKVAFVDNWPIFCLACASFRTPFVGFSCSSQSDMRQFLLTKITVGVDGVFNRLKHKLLQSINLIELYFLYLENNRMYPVTFFVTQDTSSFLSRSLLTVKRSSSYHLLGDDKVGI